MSEQEVKTLAGIMQVLEAADDHLSLQIGQAKAKAWAAGCTTPFDEIKSLGNKNVIADYTEAPNKKFPNSPPFKNVIKVVENADVAPSTPVSPGGESMTKEDWALKDRLMIRRDIAVAFIEGRWDCATTLPAAEEWFKWITGLPQNPATKPQEDLFANPPMSTRAKPAAIPPAQGAKTSNQLWGEINDFVATHKWGANKLRQEAMRLANENKWENGEDISRDGIKAMDLGQLTHFVAFLKTEIAKVAK